MTHKKEDKIRYKAFSFRLNEETYKTLRRIRLEEDISWNKLIYKLIKSYKSLI